MRASLDPMCMTKRVLPDQKWAKMVYNPFMQVEQENFANVVTTHFCCCEMRVVLKGSYHIAGVPFDAVPGNGLAEKRKTLHQLPIDALGQLITARRGFAMHAAEDRMVCLPSGFIIMTASTGCHFLRWAVSIDDLDLAQVKHLLADMLHSYTEMRSPERGMADFAECISEQGV